MDNFEVKKYIEKLEDRIKALENIKFANIVDSCGRATTFTMKEMSEEQQKGE